MLVRGIKKPKPDSVLKLKVIEIGYIKHLRRCKAIEIKV